MVVDVDFLVGVRGLDLFVFDADFGVLGDFFLTFDASADATPVDFFFFGVDLNLTVSICFWEKLSYRGGGDWRRGLGG